MVDGEGEREVDLDEVKILLDEIKIFLPLDHYYWGLW